MVNDFSWVSLRKETTLYLNTKKQNFALFGWPEVTPTPAIKGFTLQRPIKNRSPHFFSMQINIDMTNYEATSILLINESTKMPFEIVVPPLLVMVH